MASVTFQGEASLIFMRRVQPRASCKWQRAWLCIAVRNKFEVTKKETIVPNWSVWTKHTLLEGVLEGKSRHARQEALLVCSLTPVVAVSFPVAWALTSVFSVGTGNSGRGKRSLLPGGKGQCSRPSNS